MTLSAFAALVIPAAALAALLVGWAPQGRAVLPTASESRPVERA